MKFIFRRGECKHPKENIYIFRERGMMMNAVFAADAEIGSDAVFAADFSMHSDAELGGRGKTGFR